MILVLQVHVRSINARKITSDRCNKSSRCNKCYHIFDWICETPHVCTYQYLEKHHFEIFNPINQPCLSIVHACLSHATILNFLLDFTWLTWKYLIFGDFLTFLRNSLILGQHRYGVGGKSMWVNSNGKGYNKKQEFQV